MDFASRQANIKSVLTCRICKKLCKKVTIVEECCHRFCKKCITRRITEEKLHNCPVCDLDLGCAPLQKIRPDNQVQGIRDIFSHRRREYIKQGVLEEISKKGQGKKQKSISSIVDSEALDGINDLSEPLNTLVKGVSLSKSKSPEPATNFTPVLNLDDEEDEEDDEYVPSKTNKASKSHRGRRGRKKKEIPPSEGTSSVKQKERVSPVWFTLVAADKQNEGLSPLPQIPSRYLKIKDVNMPVSYINKYLAQKLSLESEDEVEIHMLGLPILPSLQLHRLVELWLRAAPNTQIKAKVGGSAEDFVMVLTYSRSNRHEAS